MKGNTDSNLKLIQAAEKCMSNLQSIRQKKQLIIKELIKKTDSKKLDTVRKQIEEGSGKS